MRGRQTAIPFIAILALASAAGCSGEKEKAQAALTEWGAVQDLCDEGKSDEAAEAAEKLRDANPVFSEIAYDAIKNEPGYPGKVNWCSPMLGGKIVLELLNKAE